MNQALRHYYLKQLGITPWTLRTREEKSLHLSQLENQVKACQACSLHKTRTQSVFARGNSEARLMIIGEAPGFYEDKQGRPFVGKAGGLLDKMLYSIGLTEDDVYIANVLKCRPPNNRDPQSDEIEACSGYLSQQIKLVKPELILGVGKFAGQFLLSQRLPLNKMRQNFYEFEGIPVLISYHPAYLLRNARDKKRAYQDLIMVQQFLLDGQCAEKMA